ncbi:MAG: ankyrin repeat domain-containing protein, partial [Acetobacteraceae bacterium]|nr:ankyrin repeat domain-containing protein [Acetobacteraceae bacterium]
MPNTAAPSIRFASLMVCHCTHPEGDSGKGVYNGIGMASFPFRRRWRGSGRSRPRDRREDLDIGLYAPAPARTNLRADLRFSPHDWTTLWGAAALGYADLVDRMLSAGGLGIEARDPIGDTALIFAASFRRTEIARLLLDRGADVHAAGAWGWTALHHAAQSGAPDIARLLLGAGADANARDDAGRTPVFGLVGGAPAVRAVLLRLLLGTGADPGARAADGDTAVHHALRNGDGDLARILLDAGDDSLLRARGRDGDTLLLAAAWGGDLEAVYGLLGRGADVDGANRHGHTPLLLAAAEEDEEITALLRAEGATIGFLEAVVLGDADAAARLPVGYSTDLDAPINGSETPLLLVARRGRADLARLLLERGARVDVADPFLGTALDVAVRAGHAAVVRVL